MQRWPSQPTCAKSKFDASECKEKHEKNVLENKDFKFWETRTFELHTFSPRLIVNVLK